MLLPSKMSSIVESVTSTGRESSHQVPPSEQTPLLDGFSSAATTSTSTSSSGSSCSNDDTIPGAATTSYDEDDDDDNPNRPVSDNDGDVGRMALSCPSSTSVGTREELKLTPSMSTLQYARYLLYTSHFVAQFSETAWQFAIILFLAAVTDYKSLVLVSTYGLCTNGAVCFFGSTAGRYVDTSTNRLRTARIFIWSENTCVCIASILCYLLLISKERERQQSTNASETPSFNDLYSILLLIGIHIMGPIAQILDGGFLVAIERDWVVVLGKVASRLESEKQQPKQDDESTILVQLSKDKNYQSNQANDETSNGTIKRKDSTTKKNLWLTETNVMMKQIDLSCKVLSPAIAGFFIDMFGADQLPVAAIAVSVLNILSLLVEYICTARIYQLIPELAAVKETVKKPPKEEQVQDRRPPSPATKIDKILLPITGTTSTMDMNHTFPNPAANTAVAQQQSSKWTTVGWYETFELQWNNFFGPYFKQPLWYAGIGSALLYFNALTFGGLMMSYLLYRGMSMGSVGLLRGISAAIGLLGTFAYKFSAQHSTLVTTGMWSIIFQFVCISFSMVSMFVDDYLVSMALLILGVCASRIGLYVYKIAVTQLMQEHVPEHIRGNIGGTQNALNAFFQLSSFALCLIYTNPQDFVIVVAAGYAAVAIAVLLYAIGIYSRSEYFT